MSTLPEGWYPSPTSKNEEIYWDGSAWTGAARKAETEPPVEAVEAKSSEISIAGSVAQRLLARKPQRKTLIIASVVIVLIVGGGGAAVAGVVHSNQVAAQKAEAQKHAADAAAEARRAKKIVDDATRATRKVSVTAIEASIKKMAEKDASLGIFDGPILRVSCNPVNGGSTDDLSDKTTAFDCFVSTKDNGDGTQSGHFFNATENWTTGEYTYGIGKSNG